MFRGYEARVVRLPLRAAVWMIQGKTMSVRREISQ